MRWLINYIRSCFCKHEWEKIFEGRVTTDNEGSYYIMKGYRCTKCGYYKKYKSL